MVNKDKFVLLAMISMLLPGALPDAMAEGSGENGKKAAKRTSNPPKRAKQSHDTAIERAQAKKAKRNDQ